MRILAVGLGGAGQRLVRHAKTLLGDGAEIVAYRSRGRDVLLRPDFSVDASATAEERYGIRSFDGLEAALETRPDLAIIANPTHLHVPAALACARAGCHVLVEKPLGHSRDGIADLKAALGGRVGYVGYMMRFHPCLRRIHDLVRGRTLGAPLWARLEAGSYVPDWHPYEKYTDLYAVWKAMGGGVVLTESHEIDLATWFFGQPASVRAVGGKLTKHEGDAEDTASLLLDYGFPVQVNLCFMQRPPSRAIAIALEKGRIEWSGGTTLRTWSAERGAWDEFAADGHERDHLFRDQMRHVLACIRGDERPLVDVAAGEASLGIALDALEQIRR